MSPPQTMVDDRKRAELGAYHLGGEANGWRVVEQYTGRFCALKAPVRVFPHGAGYHAEFEAGGLTASATATTATGAVQALAVRVRQATAVALKSLAELGL